MEFRIEEETVTIVKMVRHFHGPCILCDRETRYGNRLPRLGLEWLQRQFGKTLRERNQRSIRIGVVPNDKSLTMLEQLLCAECNSGLLKLRWASTDERNAALGRKKKQSNRYHANRDNDIIHVELETAE